jgi:hypothetical protein
LHPSKSGNVTKGGLNKAKSKQTIDQCGLKITRWAFSNHLSKISHTIQDNKRKVFMALWQTLLNIPTMLAFVSV